MPPIRARLIVAVVVAFASGALVWFFGRSGNTLTDFDQLHTAARALVSGVDPYAVIALPAWPFRLFYPMPAVVAITPLAGLDILAARCVFAAFGAGCLAYALTRHRWLPLMGLASNSFFGTLLWVQWTPLTAASMVLPWLGFAWACKPNEALIAVAGMRERRGAVIAVSLAAVFTLATLAIDPSWPLRWREALSHSEHFAPLVMRPWGWLLLLAVFRWRDPTARVLLALAMVPTTVAPRDALFLFLTPLGGWGTVILVTGTWVAGEWIQTLPKLPYPSYVADSARIMLWTVYLPALAMVLIRSSRTVRPR